MKKNFFYALMSAIALTGAIGFTACSSDSDAVVENNPTYDGTSVRTDFAFNITKASQGTRMSGTDVQEASNFLGMSNMYLFPFNNEPADNMTTYLKNLTNYTFVNYPLGELASSEISESKSKKIYSLVFPVGTKEFLFYGTATRGAKTPFEAGRLNTVDQNGAAKNLSAVDNTDDINFSLVNIANGLGEDAPKIAKYLSQIAKTTNWAETVAIASGTSTTPVDNPGAYRALAELYQKFTSITADRCGSAEAVERTILDLFKSARAINQESSVTAVSTIAGAICDNIDLYTDDNVRVTVVATPADPANWTAKITGVNATFPANLGLPMGAALLNYNTGTKTFSYKETVAPSAGGSSIFPSGVPYAQICYPAELVYFDNSPLLATDTYHHADDFPSTPTNWDVAPSDATSSSSTDPAVRTFSSDWAKGTVKASTRAVAMKNNVNYGVALLETHVKLATDALRDNMATILGGSAADQTDIDGRQFKVTGILIGGQPGSVKWNMINADDAKLHVIYDNAVTFKNTPISSEDYSAANYTLVLDNYTTTTQKEVNIALQITNGDKDFYGKNGLIPAKSTFYLVGKLDPTISGEVKTGYTPVERPADYRITNETTARVFVQDYRTIAKINISTNALQNAYSSIPDLRSTEVVFGLSVQLNWEPGYTFEINM